MTVLRWETPSLPPLVGAKEVCEILGIPKMTLHRWLQPGSGELGENRTYMIPPKRIDAGPVWVRADVERFRDEVGHQRKPLSPLAQAARESPEFFRIQQL
jgi:hypothetical protein